MPMPPLLSASKAKLVIPPKPKYSTHCYHYKNHHLVTVLTHTNNSAGAGAAAVLVQVVLSLFSSLLFSPTQSQPLAPHAISPPQPQFLI
ncbi:putative ubiquitin-conjugating enzyme E2 20 [Sesbania bispinosa]|nr:putative ubiquitin-conjugating enzyme E2 20 [Sesbania bispinosa]